MARFGFIGPSYSSQSVTADCQKCLNFYPEAIESQAGKSAMVLYPTPGLTPFCQAPQGPVRGEFIFNGRAFAVAGQGFYELFSNGTFIQRGVVSNDGLPASITAGPNQLFFAAGGHGYVFNFATNAFLADPANLIPSPTLVGYADGFFVALQGNANIFQISGLLDATSWSLANVAAPNTFADPVVSMIVDHREIWLWGQKASTVYYNSGDPLFPFVPIPGAFIEQGCAAIYSQVKVDNTVFWLGSDERGNGIAWRAQGYVPSRVSNHAVEFAWSGYATIADAVGYAYQDQGHSFWVLYFPTANKTWVFDVATQMWHERDFFLNGVSTAHRSQCHMFAFGKHLVGDNQSGTIYTMSITLNDNFGNVIRRVRRAPHVSSEMEWMFHSKMQVDMETGLGPIPPLRGSAAPTSIVLAAPNASLWAVNVNDNGTLVTTSLSSGTAQTVVLQDLNTGTASWKLQISNTGILSTFSQTFSASNPQYVALVSNGGDLNYWITVTAGGQIQTLNQGFIARDPFITLRWSDDGGHTWSNTYDVSAGAAGNYKTRAIWRRLGRSRDRVYEVSVSDPIPWRIMDAYLTAEPGFQPTERLTTQLRKGA